MIGLVGNNFRILRYGLMSVHSYPAGGHQANVTDLNSDEAT